MQTLDAGDPSELTDHVAALFARRHGRDPLGVFTAPGRVNLIGEHVDYNGGLCLPMALPHATYAAVAPREDGVVTVRSGQQDDAFEARIDALGPGETTGWAAYAAGVLWALREDGWDLPGMDLLVHGTVPLGAGLSSSAALECSVALAAAAVVGTEVDADVRAALVRACMRAESEVVGAPTGGLDQSAVLLAREGHALLLDFDGAPPEHVPFDVRAAGLELLVVDTRVSHELTDGSYGSRREECEEAARRLGLASLRAATPELVAGLDDDVLRRRATHVVTENARVTATTDALRAGDWAQVGTQLNASHLSMRDDFEISCAELDLVVDTALQAGALGARMTGGGFGGSAIALVPAERADAVRRAVDLAFVRAGLATPGHLDGTPSPGAGVC